VERLERIGQLLRDVDAEIGIATDQFRRYGDVNIGSVRDYVKKARMKLKQIIEAIDGID
jgi:hypothetical protein